MRNNLKVSCFLSRNLGFLFFFLFLTFGSLMKHEPKFCQHEPKFPGTIFNQADQKQTLSVTVLQQIGKVHDHQYRVLLCTFIRNLSYFPQNVLQHAADYFRIFSGFFENIPRNVWRHLAEYLAKFPRIFGNILRNVWRHSPECLRKFPRMFGDIPRNITFPLFLAFPAFRSPFLYSWFYTQPVFYKFFFYI